MKISKTILFSAALLLLPTLNYANEVVETTITEPIVKVALNSADLAQLTSLKGIGEKKAQAIILYREQIGQFSSLKDLLNVKGIGEKVLEDNQSRLTL